MKKVIQNETNIKYLEALCSKIKAIRIWYHLILTMKYVHRKTCADITQFKLDIIALLKVIRDFVKIEPVPGTDNDLPVFLKSHLLFRFHMQDLLELYKNPGCFAKHSIESTCPQFKRVLPWYGSIRGQ